MLNIVGLKDVKDSINILDIDKRNYLNIYNGFLDENFSNHIIDVVCDNSTMTYITLSESEVVKYRYNPKLFAYDIFGTADLGMIILLINDMTHPSEFNLEKPIRSITSTELYDIIKLYEKLKTQ